jgi:hypothetical protein
MLYDDSEQTEVRHVIALTHYTVDVYGGGDSIPESELWIKRNCIRLRRALLNEDPMETQPIFLFSDNCSMKEDFYHALIRNSTLESDNQIAKLKPMQFESEHLVKLIQQLHASEENLQTRWINALIGRIFLALYKTAEVEEHIRMKITKKIARVSKPAFITTIKVQKIDMGHSAPLITNPKLKELNVDGDLVIEADVQYTGNFRLVISAIARIDLGPRLKAREVDLVLAGILKRLDGHILVRIKPPPSNRIWISFESIPRLDITVEPVVSSRQITYGVILRAIENKIREVVNDTLVYPNWDDIPFYDTASQMVRGGIWDNNATSDQFPKEKAALEKGIGSSDADSNQKYPDSTPHEDNLQSIKAKTMSMPALFSSSSVSLRNRKTAATSLPTEKSNVQSASAVQIDTDDRQTPRPKSFRSNSFASAASPVVSLEPAAADLNKIQNDEHEDALYAVKGFPNHSDIALQSERLVGSSPKAATLRPDSIRSSASSASSQDEIQTFQAEDTNQDLRASDPSEARVESNSSPSTNTNASQSFPSVEKGPKLNQSISTAAATAKRWFANKQLVADMTVSPEQQPRKDSRESTVSSPNPRSMNQPIGRGQPLPPPGTPLPRPTKTSWTQSALLNLTKRKTAPLPNNTARTNSVGADALTPEKSVSGEHDGAVMASPDLPPPLPERPRIVSSTDIPDNIIESKSNASRSSNAPIRRKRHSSSTTQASDQLNIGDKEDVLIIEAPNVDGSAPASPRLENSGVPPSAVAEVDHSRNSSEHQVRQSSNIVDGMEEILQTKQPMQAASNEAPK